ncbi:10022_t:CDS:2 [Entrophospora sp. SA101]|nr:10022_t:CDS:2 [Entrophospora sp. SA101]
MFTGIVEHIGEILEILALDNSISGGGGWSMKIGKAGPVLVDCKNGDSISVNGTCLTVTEFDISASWFKVGLSPETLRRTNLGELKVGDKVNLERALSFNDKFGGHFVQVTEIISIEPENNSLWYKLKLIDPSHIKYVIPKGYICVDGTSLTVCEVNNQENWFSVMLVAYTQENVIMPTKKIGDKVNLEVDMLGKYVEKLIESKLFSSINSSSSNENGENYIERIVKKYLDEKFK